MKNYVVTPLMMLILIPFCFVGFLLTIAFLGLRVGYEAAWDFMGWITD